MEFTALTEETEVAFCLPLRSLKFPKYLSELLPASRRTELSARVSREPSFEALRGSHIIYALLGPSLGSGRSEGGGFEAKIASGKAFEDADPPAGSIIHGLRPPKR